MPWNLSPLLDESSLGLGCAKIFGTYIFNNLTNNTYELPHKVRTAKVLGQTLSLRVLSAVRIYSPRLPPFSSSACDLEMQLGVMSSSVRKIRFYEHHQLIAFNMPWRWWCSGGSASVVSVYNKLEDGSSGKTGGLQALFRALYVTKVLNLPANVLSNSH